jgi:DNA-binding winged helix-turn-helix (wHTH) protein/cytochrome c-type biogenesis protein CcmH/NrfG
MTSVISTFGDFTLDARRKRLTRGGQAMELSEHQFDVLAHLVAHAGEVVSKDALIEAAWGGVAVTDNSLEQAISGLRRALGDKSRKPELIQTVPRRGYRFAADVTREDARTSDAELEALIEPYRAWVEGRAALESLERDAVLRAEQAFTLVVERAPDYAPAHRALANACVMHFEATRADEVPDADALVRAGQHAREACRLDAQSGEAWATLALVHYRSGLGVQAIAAARRAVMLEPDNWRHHLRLAYVGWGEERLRAAQKALALFPEFALARFLSGTVYVARQAFDLAEQELRAGAAAQAAQQGSHAFVSVGSYWLLGLVRLARGNEQEALESFHRELSFEASGQLYGRECAANTWYAIGAVLLRQGRREEAAAAFERALERVPAHLLAMIGLSTVRDPSPKREQLHQHITHRISQLAAAGLVVDAAAGRAALMAVIGGVEEAPPLLDEALSSAPPGSAGWTIPVDPLLNASAHEAAFALVLARLRTRAA